MPIMLKGIQLESVNLERESDGRFVIRNATYSLISSTDHVLANQTIGGYGNKLTINPSSETIKVLNSFIESYKKDITTILGLSE